MKLTQDASAALERLRDEKSYDDLNDDEEYYYSQTKRNDEEKIVAEMLRLCPPGHADEIDTSYRETMRRIHHFSTGTCDMDAKTRLRIIAKECEGLLGKDLKGERPCV